MLMTTRWQPYTNLWGKMNQFHDEMDRLLDSFGFAQPGWPALAATYPTVNIWQDSERIYAEAELPGMELNDLEIYVTGGNQLTIKGERNQPQVQGTWHRQERPFGSFTRAVALPAEVEADRVEAKFANGVLTISMPKSEQAKPRKIAVKAE